jgi:iron complex outermembrane receptor protein
MFIRLAILVIAAILMPSYLFADTLSGTVADKDGLALAGVNITIDGRSYKPTDESGDFLIDADIPVGAVITFSHVGFRPVVKKVSGSQTMYVTMQPSVYSAGGVTVHASREGDINPARPHTDFTKDDIDRDYLIGEFPLLLESATSLYSYADAGGGLGYSYIKIRGFDDKRISVYINGIPLNDPEDQATYFVDLPDFAAEVTDIQVERGIGSSMYGDASFGGSVNIVSEALERQRSVSLSTGYGSYFADGDKIGDMRKQALEYSSGLIGGRWSFAGRYSDMYSDGYRKNSWYDGWSYFLSVSRLDPNMTTTINAYGGPMKMHLAYYGTDRETLREDRRFNYLTYDNETDNFNQPHYELHNTYWIDDNKRLSTTLYYIRGNGYYEQYKENSPYSPVMFEDYNIPPVVVTDGSGNPADTVVSGDLVRQQWVSKDQVGLNPRLDIQTDDGSFYVGGAFYLFESDHWGQVVWAERVSADLMSPGHRYYEYFGSKFSGSLYAGRDIGLTDRLRLSLKLQTRMIDQDFQQSRIGAFSGDNDYNLDWFFVSPRATLVYSPVMKLDLSLSSAISSRTPADWAILDASDPYATPELGIKPERAYDFEIGGVYRYAQSRIGVNLYWMELRNEIVPSGGINDLGYPITVNADRSVHAGIETETACRLLDHLSLSGNLSITYDRSKEFSVTRQLYDNDVDWNPVGTVEIDYGGNPLAGFPTYLGNLIADLTYGRYRVTGRAQFAGRQYIENGGNRDASIDPYSTFSASTAVTLTNPAGLGRLVLTGKVDNLFNSKYETSGFWDEYNFRDIPDQGTGYYIPAAERSFFVQAKLELE